MNQSYLVCIQYIQPQMERKELWMELDGNCMNMQLDTGAVESLMSELPYEYCSSCLTYR